MIKELPFKYKSRIYRIVWEGLGIVRLQDNHGDTHVVSKHRYLAMKYNVVFETEKLFNNLTF